MTLLPSLSGLRRYAELWPMVLVSICKNFEMKVEDGDSAEGALDKLESEGYQAGFSRLVFSGQSSKDAFPEIPDAKVFFRAQLAKVGQAVIAPLVQGVPEAAKPLVMPFFQ